VSRFVKPASLLLVLVMACGGEEPPEPTTEVAEPGPIVVDTQSGAVKGWREAGVQSFLGLPYAEPPVESLRWAPPQPVAPWEDELEVLAVGSACPQQVPIAGPRGEEDCLSLNIHLPDPAPSDAPVMVWLHGGGFVLGQGMQSDGGTAGDRLALATGSVVVSVNYRLGALGFLAHPALTDEQGASGNYGLLDQVEALRWVAANIEAFGGDPDNITLFGQSAGSISVCHHLLSPLSQGLFQKAIVQSGSCTLPTPSLQAAEGQGASYAEALGCDGGDVVSCLRAASLEQVRSTLPPPPAFLSTDPQYGVWMPIVDGRMVEAPPETKLAAGEHATVPILTGWTKNEGTLFVMLAYEQQDQPVTEDNYQEIIAANVGGDALASQVVEQYPLSDFSSPFEAISQVLGDALFVCPGRDLMRTLAASTTTYGYQFDYPDAAFQLPAEVPLGAYHSSEVQFIFGYAATLFVDDLEGEQIDLSAQLMSHWGRFARAGDPNADGDTSWQPYDPSADEQWRIDISPSLDSGIGEDACAFWAQLDYLTSPL